MIACGMVATRIGGSDGTQFPVLDPGQRDGQALPQAAKQLARGRAGARRALFSAGLPRERAQLLELGHFDAGCELRPGRFLVGDQAGPPVLEVVLATDPTLVCHGELGQVLLDRLDVDAPHQLADVLALAQARTVARDAASRLDGVAELLRQRRVVELRCGQVDQLLAEPLDLLAAALQLALARRLDPALGGAFHPPMLARAGGRPIRC
jgi:hypothetical protein